MRSINSVLKHLQYSSISLSPEIVNFNLEIIFANCANAKLEQFMKTQKQAEVR